MKNNRITLFPISLLLLVLTLATEVLVCQVRTEDGLTCADYRRLVAPWNELRPSDPVAADRVGNHSPGEPLHVLLKDGSVLELGPDDPLWKRCGELLGP